MLTAKRFALILLGLFVLWNASAGTAWAVDVYVVYSGREGNLRKSITNVMSSDLSVRSYNIDLLALADYSGKQKAVGKISRASVVIIVGSRPLEILKKAKIKCNVLVVGNTSKSLKATEALIFVVNQGASTRGISGRKATVKSADDIDAAASAKIVLVDDESSLSVFEVTALIAEFFAG